MVDSLIPCEEDSSLLISRFQEYLEYDDVRYFVMKAVTENIGQVMQKTKKVMGYCGHGGPGRPSLWKPPLAGSVGVATCTWEGSSAAQWWYLSARI